MVGFRPLEYFLEHRGFHSMVGFRPLENFLEHKHNYLENFLDFLQNFVGISTCLTTFSTYWTDRGQKEDRQFLIYLENFLELVGFRTLVGFQLA